MNLRETIEKSDEEAKKIFSEWLHPNFDMLEDFLASRDKALIEAYKEELRCKIRVDGNDIIRGDFYLNETFRKGYVQAMEHILAIITKETLS